MRVRSFADVRPVLAITAIGTGMIGNALRMSGGALGRHPMWWMVFALASVAATVALVRPTHLTISVAGAAALTVMVSRAAAIWLSQFAHDAERGVPVLLAVTMWLLMAYYVGALFMRLLAR